MSSLLVSKKEKEKQVLKLATEGKITRDIAKAVHISLKDIGTIIHKATGDNDDGHSEKEKQEEKEKQKRLKSLSSYAQAFQMFKDKKFLVDVAIELDQETDIVLNYYRDYLRLTRMKGLVAIYDELRMNFPFSFICIDG